jgi:NADPH:quinone reductase-like Zn-dependent oxidoreductase
MKAIIQEAYGGPEQLRLADIPIPEPGKGQMQVKVLACGVNLSDWEYLVGAPFYARMVGGYLRPKQPVLGSDIVGIVEKLGPDVTEFSLGDRVMGDVVMVRGGFAQFACVTAADMVIVPEGLSDEVAACLPQAGGIAVAGTQSIQQGDRLLINGAGGGSGTMALQLAKAAGAHVTAVDNSSKIEWLKSLGADEVIDYRLDDFARSGEKWDRILDMVATRGPVQISGVLAKGGIYRALGGNVSVLLSLVFGGLFFRLQKKRIGMLLVPSGRDLTQQTARLATEEHIRPHLEAVLPLPSVPEALRRTGLGEVKGKLVINPQDF